MGVFDTVIVGKENIEKYIPQKYPFVMVDTLHLNEETQTASSLTINPDNILVNDEGFFSESGIIEHIAQTAALRSGYHFLSQNKPVPVGFIGALKNLKIYKLPHSGTTLNTIITIQNEIFECTIIHGVVYVAGEAIAECEMKIFLKPE